MKSIVINGRFLSQRLTGVQRVATELTRAIDRKLGEAGAGGLSVRLVIESGVDPEPLRLRNIPVARAPGLRGHAWEQWVLPRHVQRGETLLCLGNTAPLISLLGQGRVAVMLHDQAFKLFPGDYSRAYRAFHSFLGKMIVAQARPVLTVSRTECRTLLARNPDLAGKIVVAPNGSWIDDLPATQAPGGEENHGEYLLYVGSFTHRKNAAGAFRVAVELAQSRGLRSLFVGPQNELSKSFERGLAEDLKPLIRFRGYVEDHELADLYRRAIALLYPSLYEASGLPPSEAMWFHCPVIVSDLPVLRERCGDAALYCDPHELGSIRAAVTRLMDDAALRRSLAANGRRHVSQFTWRSQAECVLGAIAE